MVLTIIGLLRLRKRTDIVFVPFTGNAWVYGIYLPLICGMMRTPYVISIHGGGMHRRGPTFVRRILFTRAAGIIGVSDLIKREYEKRTGKTVHHIPPLVPFGTGREEAEEVRSRIGLGAEDTVILYVGSLKQIKGCATLLEAFLGIPEDIIRERRLRLLFVGDGVQRRELEERVREEGSEAHVLFTGRIRHESVAGYFAASDMYVIPSEFEGTPVSLLEAMHNGMPVIGADSPGINTIIEDGKNGSLFPASDQGELRGKILQYLEQPSRADEMGRNAGEWYRRNFRYDDVIDRHLRIFSEVVGEGFSE
jgi:glycosyltransferase involved in cell wall biosynthesis